MLDQSLYAEILDNEIIMESFREMALAQEGQDRIKFVSIATEALANPAKQSALLNKLFKDVQKVEAIDFGKIPDSKGDLTKYHYYDQMYDCIELLNNITAGNPTPNIISLNKLHQILLDARNDFTFGYRTNNMVIVNMYNLMVTSLYEMINVCVVDATEHLRAKLSMQAAEVTMKQTRWVTKTVNQFIKMYENGQWNTLMKTFKSSGHQMVAQESDTYITSNVSGPNDSIPHTSTPVSVVKNVGDALSSLKKVPGITKDTFNKMPLPAKVIAALVSAFVIMRSAVYLFFAGAGRISTYLKTNASLLRAAISADSDKTASSVETQKRLLNAMDKVADTIDYKILKAEKAAGAELKKNNREDLNPQEIGYINGGDFEL